MGIVRFALRFPHTFYVMAGMVLFLGCSAILVTRKDIFPAINIPESGTRREELLFGRETDRYQALRRALHRMRPKEAMVTLLRALQQYPTNRKLLAHIADTIEEA